MTGIVQGLLATFGVPAPFSFTITQNFPSPTNLNLHTVATNAGWNGVSKVICTIDNVAIISSNSTATPALTVSGSFPNGVELINQGTIVGMGGAGGAGGSVTSGPTLVAPGAGFSGGTALSVSVPLTLNNTGTIAGGGGGGGGGSAAYEGGGYDPYSFYGGGGGGGGRSSNAANSSGGPAGVPTGGDQNISGTSGNIGTYQQPGEGGLNMYGPQPSPSGGYGGGWGSNGNNGVTLSGFSTGAAGGGAGNAISGNSNITYIATGTRLGPIT